MDSQTRILEILLRLQNGEQLTKNQLVTKYKINERTIQRDFSLLKYLINDQALLPAEISYDAKHYSYHMERGDSFDKKEVLIISKILLESRALNKAEMNALLDGLLKLLNADDAKAVKNIIGSEQLAYKGIINESERISKIWQLTEYIRQEKVIEISYKNHYSNKLTKFQIWPVALFFDNNYFYLVGYNNYRSTYNTLRIDYIIGIEETNEKKPNISYGQKYRDGDERNYRVDAFQGAIRHLTVEYSSQKDFILDRFPESRVLSEEGDKLVIDLVAQWSPGTQRWLLSQTDVLKIINPPSAIKWLTETLEKNLKKYK
ncbi:MAG: WYL domain-containing protein [Streptococcaceae bacterium]|nr:WYL domain-containing protein [Streptococcaceae bacterium]